MKLLFLCLVSVCSAFLPLHSRTAHQHGTKTLAKGVLSSSRKSQGDDDASDDSKKHVVASTTTLTRRDMMISSLGAAVLACSTSAEASVPEIDNFGNLFTPKTEMLAGGSTAARGGVALQQRSKSAAQFGSSIYETRFVAYLARFLLNFEPSARAYWTQQGYGFSWTATSEEINNSGRTEDQAAFAAFAESVEVGLADYFSGPYGSYSSVQAAVAGIPATQPAPSRRPPTNKKNKDQRKQGILNLYSLLKARYDSVSARRQLAILFSFVSDPELQPTKEIRQLLGETDNASVTKIGLTGSVRSRGGYALDDLPVVTIDDPPPLGDKYCRAIATPIVQPTSRILRIDVVDGGEGYSSAPAVSVFSGSPLQRLCQSAAILDRNGHVESIIVLDPGFGYAFSKKKPPRVQIDSPNRKGGRRARAVAVLEYELVGVDLQDHGNGFVATEPPSVSITPPRQNPDWYVDVITAPTMRMVKQSSSDELGAVVLEMQFADGNVAYSVGGVPNRSFTLTDDFINLISRDPLELLPSAVRPELVEKNGKSLYCVLPLASVPQYVAVLAPRYRAYDPVFGGVGRLPVTKGAAALTVSEYARLALSGAVCTVVVRTLLNPLELIKTKQQLGNDDELFHFARYGNTAPKPLADEGTTGSETFVSANDITSGQVGQGFPADDSATAVFVDTRTFVETAVNTTQDIRPIGTVEMIRAMVQLRGISSLFQSLDITFLASIPFGSFGFGATELFRRSFTEFFASGEGSEISLLLAASAATVITAAAVSPFEVLRVRSMGSLKPQPWTEVLEDFLQEKSKNSGPRSTSRTSGLKLQELLSLWSGFAPILSRELPFAIAKFLTFDFVAIATVNFLNSRADPDSLPIQIGVGLSGLAVSASAGAIAGVVGAFVSHPADLILTKTSAQGRKAEQVETATGPAWILVVRDLVSKEGGVTNLFVGLSSRSIFFFLVIGLQFCLYDYVKNLFQVGSDDLSLVLDVFYSVRAGLAGINPTQ